MSVQRFSAILLTWDQNQTYLLSSGHHDLIQQVQIYNLSEELKILH